MFSAALDAVAVIVAPAFAVAAVAAAAALVDYLYY